METSDFGEPPAEAIRSAADPRLGAALLALHAATDVESLWSSGVALLRASMPGFHHLLGLPSVGAMPVLLRTTMPTPDEPDCWVDLDCVTPFERTGLGNRKRKVSRLSDDVPFVLLRSTPFYRQFMEPAGWRYSAALFFWDGDRFLGHLALTRTLAQGDFTEVEMELLGELYPHLETAINRVLLLDRERSARLSIEESVQRSPLPTAVLDWELTPLYHNRAAAEASAIWRHGPEIARSLKPHFELPIDLVGTCRGLGEEWEHLVFARARSLGTHERIVPHHTLTSCHALIRLLEGDRAQFTKPHFLVQWSLLGLADEPNRAVQMLARLTPAERQVALLAARGLENQAIAEELAVSCSTVRTHLRSIFSKLGITSRSRLAALQSLERTS